MYLRSAASGGRGANQIAGKEITLIDEVIRPLASLGDRRALLDPRALRDAITLGFGRQPPRVTRETLKRRLPGTVLIGLRRLNRLRWLTKYRLLRGVGIALLANRMLGLRYVLLDPELESYTYDIEDEAGLAEQLAGIFGVPVAQVASYIEETHRDPELNGALRKRVRWRFDTKRRLALGSRLTWYSIVRLQKPALVVETGVLTGLGSLTVLRALARNAEEGHHGRLVSVDSDPAAGWLVPEHLRHEWTKLVGFGAQVLPQALRDERVGVFFQDTPHDYENQSAEFAIALAHADDPIVLVDCGGGPNRAMQEICDAGGAQYHLVEAHPIRHIYPVTKTGIAMIPKARQSASG